MNYSYSVIYNKIEEEVIKLSSAIYFCDEQKEVYSVDIADLITRCSVELEAIVKEIYYRETGVFSDVTGEIIKWMEERWHISKKKIRIEYPSFDFDSFREFSPFNYISKSQEDYYSSYNAIKHNRAQNIKKANLNTLIRVLGALFITETYYENKRISLSDDKYGATINRMGISSIFSFLVAPCEDEIILDSEKSIIPDTCMYKITKTEGEYAFRISYQRKNGQIISSSLVNRDCQFQQFAREQKGKEVDVDALVRIIRGDSFHSDIPSKEYLANILNVEKINSIYVHKFVDRYYAELNK